MSAALANAYDFDLFEAPRLIKQHSVQADTWLLLEADSTLDDIPARVDVIVPFSLWKTESAALATHNGRVGVWLESDQAVEELAGSIAQLPLIALNFPHFTDGRHYSSARLLRERYGFKGELRAIGDVLRDQLFFLQRCGFDAFVIREDRCAEDALNGLKDFSQSYQAASDQPLPLFRRR